MLNYENFAISLARAVDVFRVAPEVNEQKAALRTVVALAKLGAVTVKLSQRTLLVESAAIPPTLPGIKSLIAQMDLHGVAEIRIAQNAAASDLLELLRGLAGGVDGYDRGGGIGERLRAADVSSVRVVAATSEVAPQGARAASVTDAFESAGILEAAEQTRAEAAAIAAATRTHRPGTSLEQAVERLALDPTAPDVLDQLTAFQHLVQREETAAGIAAVVRAVSELIRIEEGLPDGSPRRNFSIVRQRILKRSFLESVVQLIRLPEWTEAATRVVQRAGPDATGLLLDWLIKAESSAERRAYFDALRDMSNGADQAVRLLDHPEWYVVRNMAELLGEQRSEMAVRALGRALRHGDSRVRKAAAVALAKIGTAATVEYLREALQKGNAEVRTLVASAVAGRKSGALTMPLVFAADGESDPEVQRQFYLALARIGTPNAIQALVQAAQPGGRFFRRRRPEARLAAIDGLRAAAGPAAVGTLEALRDDPNRLIRKAAREALEDLGES